MKKQLTVLFIATLATAGCMSTRRWAKFRATSISTREFFGDLRLARIKPTTGTTGIGGYAYWTNPSLAEANGFRFSVVRHEDRSHHPTFTNIMAEFGPSGQTPSRLRVVGTNDESGILLLFDQPITLNERDLYRLRLEFTAAKTRYVFTSVGPITETVEREFYLIPLPNAGFSRAMN